MSTTIQVKRQTLKLLEHVKKRMKLPSYDEVINQLIRRELNLRGEMFGVDKGRITHFTEEDRLEERT